MTVYLVLKTFNGEPVAVFSEEGRSTAAEGHDGLVATARTVLDERVQNTDWAEYVDAKADTVNMRYWWTRTDSNEELEDVLVTERRQYDLNSV